jgi:dihydrofolate reductase
VTAPRGVAVDPAKPVGVVLVAAVADNGVIGRAGGLPWRLRSDMRHFRTVTIGRPVVMGRRTYLSIGKPLAGRTNIVVSRDRSFAAAGVLVAPRVETALAVARADALRRGVDEIAVIGGADLYAQTIALAERLVITHVHLQPSGDTRFAPIDSLLWREVSRSEHAAGPDDEAAFAVAVYQRRPVVTQGGHGAAG